MARYCLLATASLLLAAPAFGQNVEDGAGKPYVFGQASTLRYQQRSLEGFRDNTAVQTLIGGYNINRFFAVEAGYSQTGNLSYPDPIDATMDLAEVSMNFYTVRALGRIPLTEIAPGGSIIGGIGYNSLSTSTSGNPGMLLGQESSLNSWLIGGEISGQNMQFRLTWEEFDLSRTKTYMFSFAVGYRF